MKRQASLFLCCWIISGLTACNLPVRSTPDTADQGISMQYQTVSALLTATAQITDAVPVLPTQSSVGNPTQFPQMTFTPTPEVTEEIVLAVSVTQPARGPLEKSSSAKCNLANPGRPIDITVPDETHMYPGEYFSKTWRFVNGGSCGWDQNYSVVWFSGDDLGLSREQRFQKNIPPGMPVDVTVDMVAPETPGTYQSNWKLRNSQGELFGIGPNGDSPFWVRIVVVPLETATVTPTLTIPTTTPTPVVMAEGVLVLKLDEALDLDSGVVNLLGEEDLRFQLAGEDIPVLMPLESALVAPFGAGRPGFNDCLLAPLSVEPVRLDLFQPGTYFCYRTAPGEPGWFLITSLDLEVEEAGLEFLTWSMP